jgi:PAS domain S-box-containing protein
MSPKNTSSDIQFLAGGGEMGRLTREKDWSKNSLGTPDTWPQSLRTTLGILLNSKFPMFLWWGKELICFYNDAYRPSLGKEGKHPSILGTKAIDAWPEIWDIIKPMIDSVLATGEATWNEDALIPIYRNNKIEDVYWTFSYSPVYDENNMAAGVLVTCTETTDKVNTLKQLNESSQRYLNNIQQAPIAMCVLRGKDFKVEIVNELMLEIWGKELDEVINKPIFEGLPEAKEQGLEQLLENVCATGEKFVANERPVLLPRKGKMETTYINFVYEALMEADGSISGIVATANEVTNQVLSREKLEQSEQKVRDIVANAPFAIAVYTGEEMRIEMANQAIIDIWGKGNDVIGKTFTEVLPELKAQSVFEQIKNVYATGEAFDTKNTPLDLVVDGKKGTYYFNYDFIPLYDLSGKIYGVMNTGVDLTDLNLAKQKIEESDTRFRSTVKQAPVGIIILRGRDYVVEMVNDSYMEIVDFNESEFVGLPLFDSIPEAKESTLSLMDHVLDTGEPYYGYEVTVPLRRNNNIEFCNFDFVYHPLKEEDGSISGMIVTVTDVTEKVASRKKIEQSEERFRNTVKQAPTAIAIFKGKNYIAEMVNNAYLELVDRTENELVGYPLFETLPEVQEIVKPLLDGVYDTGIPFHGYEIAAPIKRKGEIGIYNFDLLYAPLREDDGTISGIIVTATDVTDKVEARKKIEQNEQRLNIVIEASELGTWELNVKTREAIYSDRYLQIIGGYTESIQLTHDQLLAHLHPDDMAIRNKAVKDAIATGYLQYEARMIWNDKSIHWMEGKGKVFYDEAGEAEKMIGTIRDITKEKAYNQELEANEKRFRLMTDNVPVLIWMAGTDKLCYFFNKGWLSFTGRTMEQESGNGWADGVHPADFDRCLDIYTTSFDKREEFYMEYRLRRHDGEYRWVSDKGVPRYNSKGEFDGYIGACMDIHNEKANKQLLIENEQKFRLLADSMPQHIWTADVEGNLNYYNESVVNFSGMSLEEIHKKGWLDIVHPDDRDENTKLWMHSIVTGEDFIFEHRFRRYDGEYRWQLSRATPQKDEDGKIQMWVGTSTDIQDQKEFTHELEKKVSKRTKELNHLNEVLKQSEERYHLMVEEVQDYAILYLNKEGIVENWNKGAEKIKGYKSEEIVGKSFENFYSAEDRARNLPQFLLSQAAKYGRYGQEGWRVRKDGTLFWASVVITAVHNNAGDIIGFSKVTHDLTAKKAADDKIKLNAAELEQKNAELEKMNKELQSFAYISSHDLQEPLRKIQTFSNMIIEKEFDNLSDTGKDKFKRMQNAAQRMQTLINDLLAYSRTNTQEIKLEKTDLNRIITDVIEDLKEEIHHKNATIEAEKLKCDVEIIPFQFQQLLFNLLSNALKFSKTDIPPVIKIKCEIQKGSKLNNDKLNPDLDYCHINFSDNGIGFEQQYSEKIFEVFQRLHGKEIYQGTGIGLAIVKKIVDNHKGFITAESGTNKGATFDIYIPAKG